MSDTKNPFEIRLEILKMAKDVMDTEYHQASERYWNMLNESMNRYNKSAEEAQKMMEKYIPKMYSPQEVLDKANEFYTFIMKKN